MRMRTGVEAGAKAIVEAGAGVEVRVTAEAGVGVQIEEVGEAGVFSTQHKHTTTQIHHRKRSPSILKSNDNHSLQESLRKAHMGHRRGQTIHVY